MATYTSFEQLECWQLCRVVVNWVREVVRLLPPHEKYDMKWNMTRAARSSTRNIAEGFGRYQYKDRIRFCRTSRGSLYEILDDVITCVDEGYLDEGKGYEGRLKISEAIRSVNGYIKYLRSRGDAGQAE